MNLVGFEEDFLQRAAPQRRTLLWLNYRVRSAATPESGRCRKAEQKDYYLFLSGKTIGRSSIPSLPLFLVSTSAVVEFLHLLLINDVREIEREELPSQTRSRLNLAVQMTSPLIRHSIATEWKPVSRLNQPKQGEREIVCQFPFIDWLWLFRASERTMSLAKCSLGIWPGLGILLASPLGCSANGHCCISR